VDEIVSETSWERERVVSTLFQLQANGAIELAVQLTEPLEPAA
jgi:hypothetical protein